MLLRDLPSSWAQVSSTLVKARQQADARMIGGHTGEMLRLLETMDLQRYSERVYLLSTGDALSERRVLEVERTNGTGNVRGSLRHYCMRLEADPSSQFSFRVIPRARKVHQSYVTAVFTTSWTLLHCLWLACALPLLQRRQFADVVLLNGPGSCVPLAAAIALPQVRRSRARVGHTNLNQPPAAAGR